MNAKVTVLADKQKSIVRGHPWIFPKAIAKTSGKLVTGELVDIYDEEGSLLGVGAYNEHSLYRVRILALANEQCDFSHYKPLIKHRLQQALWVRMALNLPNDKVTAYRLFNSEADGLSGLTIDRFNETAVVSSTAYWVESNKEVIIQTLHELYADLEIIWLPQVKSLAQDGWSKTFDEQLSQKKVEVFEAGIVYQIEFANAQKTGLFIDQRENHERIANVCKGKKVLDLYTYTGGFALHAARAGAAEVTAVDSSAQAIAQAKHNAFLNSLKHIDFIEADARDYLSKAGDYDVIILDPPKLVPSKQHLQKAKNYYRFLHREVFKYMKVGSLLMTCNCSSALSAPEFTALVSAQASAVGKQARIIGVYGPASCHPTLASFPEGNYLTAVLIAVV